MPSGKRAKQQRREAAKTPPPVRSKGGGPAGARQASPRTLAIGGAVIVIVIIAVVLAVVLGKSNGNGGGSTSTDGPSLKLVAGTPATGSSSAASALPGAGQVAALFKGIPQNHFVLGSPSAPVELTEFIDLQCPDCQIFETTMLPALVKNYVKTGKLRIKVEPWSILDRTPTQYDSDRGQKATIAAAAQNKAFQFAEILYDNQPPNSEGTGWMNDAIISAAAASVDGLKPAQLVSDANSSATQSLVHQVDSTATSLNAKFPGFTGTPGLFLSKGNAAPQLYGAGVPNLSDLEHAIDALLK